MLSLLPEAGPRSPSTAGAERGRARRALSFALAALSISGSLSVAASAVRRAAISDTLLASEVEGSLFLEVLAEKGDTAQSLASTWATSDSAAGALREANDGAEPQAGRFYRLPIETLLDEHRRAVLSALYPEEIPRSPLTFAADSKGPYAVYRLKRGEALYSNVVVRFCGRVDPQEVSLLSEEIATRSGVTNVRKIPADHPIHIPLDLLSPEFMPAGTPEREEVEETLAAAARHKLSKTATQLEGVHVILDAGHGGDDSGAIIEGVDEDEYAYDVMCRVRDLLLKKTRAKVITTIRDRSSGFSPLEGVIGADRDEYLLTDPPYDLKSNGATVTGVNMRWKLANKELSRLAAEEIPGERVVFLSLHADSLHPSLRGTMIYVPGREHRRTFPAGVSAADLDRSEGLSRSLAREIVASLRAGKLTVHSFLPIRNHVIRSGRRWIPAVLRASKVPHSLLIEIANLNNASDRDLIVKSDFRQRLANAVVDALGRYYSKARKEPPGSRRPPSRRLESAAARVK
jgi:N-acetylmuramoyl-L-alanine amidase